MELTCPQCKNIFSVSDSELFPSCDCGYVFESMPILDKPALGVEEISALFEETPSIPKGTPIKKTPPAVDEVIVCTSSLDPRYQIDQYLGIVAVEVMVNEAVVVEELARNIPSDQMVRYQEAINNLISRLKGRARTLGGNAVTDVRIEHRVLTVGLGGPGLMIFAQGTVLHLPPLGPPHQVPGAK